MLFFLIFPLIDDVQCDVTLKVTKVMTVAQCTAALNYTFVA